MNPEYRIYFKKKQQYATNKQLKKIYLRSDGSVWQIVSLYLHKDITRNVVVETWTTIKDIDGKKVFDGDTYKWCPEKHLPEYTATIRWSDKSARFVLTVNTYDQKGYNQSRPHKSYHLQNGKGKVIGTVHSDETEASDKTCVEEFINSSPANKKMFDEETKKLADETEASNES